jgi:beta-glucosidase
MESALRENEALESEVNALLAAMTVEEKLSLLAGKSFWQTRGIPRLGLAPMKLTDGPRGIGFHSGFRRCTAFPTVISLAASWNPELAREFGEALALEARSVSAQVVLGPAVNICRTPLNGRTFEYFTEDPISTAGWQWRRSGESSQPVWPPASNTTRRTTRKPTG